MLKASSTKLAPPHSEASRERRFGIRSARNQLHRAPHSGGSQLNVAPPIRAQALVWLPHPAGPRPPVLTLYTWDWKLSYNGTILSTNTIHARQISGVWPSAFYLRGRNVPVGSRIICRVRTGLQCDFHTRLSRAHPSHPKERADPEPVTPERASGPGT
eukprot:1745813-Pyramimonas_sp.AAC.1